MTGPLMPVHGEERGRRQVERITNTGTFRLPGGHKGVCEVEIVTGVVSRPESERWCSNCQAWQSQVGIVAILVGCRSCGASWEDAADRSGLCAARHPDDSFVTCALVCGHEVPEHTAAGLSWLTDTHLDAGGAR